MQQKVKLTKRQIKEDKFTAFMLKSRTWFIESWQFVAIGAAAVILLVVAGVFYARSRETSREAAAAQFARALLDYRQGNNQVASMAMQGILDEHDGTDVAEQATFLLGKLSLRQRNYPEAVRYFELYLSQYRDDKLMRAASHAGIAGALENQGQFADAAARYVQAIDEFSDGPLTGDYQLAALRCYVELNDGEKARGLLTELQDKFKGTELANRAARIFGEKFPG